MEFTGERMVPGGTDEPTFWEHIYRYRFAAGFARGKRVLDIACGEGYGSAALRQAGAIEVVGVDTSEEACRHAQDRYGIDARVGSAEDIPLEDSSVDLIVSFETIEHLVVPDRLIRECIRVLAPGGRLIISTPNKKVFASVGGYSKFHQSELSSVEFTSLIAGNFNDPAYYGQMVESASWFSPLNIVALRSPWLKIPASLRVRNHVTKLLCRQFAKDARYSGEHAVELAASATDTAMCKLVNPYHVRPCLPPSLDSFVYMLAVAGTRRTVPTASEPAR
jgi:SAM-dependent methyltransferase